MQDSAHDPEHADESAEEVAPRDDDSLEFDGADLFAARGRRRLLLALRAALAVVPVLLVLVVILTQTGQLFVDHLQAPVEVTVACDVPWMTLRLDNGSNVTACRQAVPSAPPTATLRVMPGAHVLTTTADGFASENIPFSVARGNAPFLPAKPQLTVDGALHILDAANAYLAHAGYMQRVMLPAVLWRDLNLSAPPRSTYLIVEERFEAVAVDPLLPTFEQASYLRPISPDPGAVGAAVVVVEHVVITDGCSSQPLVRREAAVFSRARAGVVFSVTAGAQAWSATHPYALRPAANVYSDRPLLASQPATPAMLYALAARTQLAALRDDAGALTDAIVETPVIGTTAWGGGVLLSDQDVRIPQGANSSATHGATWLYVGGMLFGLTADSTRLVPLASPASPAIGRWLANARTTSAVPVC